MVKRLLLLMMFTSLAWAELEFQRIGASLANDDAALSCWLVQGQPVGPLVAVKIAGVGKEGEANVLLDKTQLKELKRLCKKASSYRENLKDGQIVILGTLSSYESRLEVVVLQTNGMVVRCLVAHEKDQEQGFRMETFQEASLFRLLEDCIATLR